MGAVRHPQRERRAGNRQARLPIPPDNLRNRCSLELVTILQRSTMNLIFVESRVFSSKWHARLDDERLRALQNELLEDPSRGEPIPGCGILRKLRFGDASRGKGKRGGVRVIYVHTPEASRIDLVTVYGKDEADDLTKHEISALCTFADQLRAEARAGVTRTKLRKRE